MRNSTERRVDPECPRRRPVPVVTNTAIVVINERNLVDRQRHEEQQFREVDRNSGEHPRPVGALATGANQTSAAGAPTTVAPGRP